MTASELLRSYVRERRDRINKPPARVAIRTLPKNIQALVRVYQLAARAKARTAKQLERAGYQTHSLRPGSIQPYVKVQKHNVLLTTAQREAELALLRATSATQRAAAIDTFVARTREIMR